MHVYSHAWQSADASTAAATSQAAAAATLAASVAALEEQARDIVRTNYVCLSIMPICTGVHLFAAQHVQDWRQNLD